MPSGTQQFLSPRLIHLWLRWQHIIFLTFERSLYSLSLHYWRRLLIIASVVVRFQIRIGRVLVGFGVEILGAHSHKISIAVMSAIREIDSTDV